MFESLSAVPENELRSRWDRAREYLRETAPEASGLLIFSKVNVYYFSGTLGQGAFWLPLEGEPVLMIRKGIERARLESMAGNIVSYKSFKDFAPLAREAGSPMNGTVAVPFSGLTWQLGEMLKARMPDIAFVPGDMVVSLARSVKSEWELSIMRLCGRRHHQALYERLPGKIAPGMTEREIAHKSWEVFFSLGHQGMLRMGGYGEECFLGHVSAGDSGNYPSSFNGPVGLRGEHPAVPFMGYSGQVWKPGTPLALDIGFSLDGYVTDKTQLYWAGEASSMTEEARRGHDMCVEIQQRACEMLKPGALPSEIYTMSLEVADKAGLSEGYMGLGGNKVPFLGHGIGLVIDEFPALARGFDRPLEAGMVLALEPKQGIPGLGMVGVENTFEVTESGGVCITGEKYDMIPVV